MPVDMGVTSEFQMPCASMRLKGLEHCLLHNTKGVFFVKVCIVNVSMTTKNSPFVVTKKCVNGEESKAEEII